MKLKKQGLVKKISAIIVSVLLFGCSVEKPSGSFYITNKLGVTVPVTGTEISILPGKTQADFFYQPVSESLLFASEFYKADMKALCPVAKKFLSTGEEEINNLIKDLKLSEYMPKTDGECKNICLEKEVVNKQLITEKTRLDDEIASINLEIKRISNEVKQLEAAKNKKLGVVGDQLAKLESERAAYISKKSNELRGTQRNKLKILIGLPIKFPSLYRGERIGLSLYNGSDYTIGVSSEGGSYSKKQEIVVQRYFLGSAYGGPISIQLPAYGYDEATKKDQYGFDKKYYLDLGESRRVGNQYGGIYNINIDSAEARLFIEEKGLVRIGSPQGKLLKEKNGWKGRASNYFAPDGTEIVVTKGHIAIDKVEIVSIPSDFFVIADHKGVTKDGKIIYSPQKVDFEKKVSWTPQNKKIAELKKNNKSITASEDKKISSLEKQIANLKEDKSQLLLSLQQSDSAKNFASLSDSQSKCTSAQEEMSSYESEIASLRSIIEKFSCGDEGFDTFEVYQALNLLNAKYGEVNFENIDLAAPNIMDIYELKAKELIFSKLARHSKESIQTDKDGSFYLSKDIDSDSLIFAKWGFDLTEYVSNDYIWLETLERLGERKDLNNLNGINISFEDYIDFVVQLGIESSSREIFYEELDVIHEEASKVNLLSTLFNDLSLKQSNSLAELQVNKIDDFDGDGFSQNQLATESCDI